VVGFGFTKLDMLNSHTYGDLVLPFSV